MWNYEARYIYLSSISMTSLMWHSLRCTRDKIPLINLISLYLVDHVMLMSIYIRVSLFGHCGVLPKGFVGGLFI